MAQSTLCLCALATSGLVLVWKRKDTTDVFSPLIAFPAVYLAWFAAGSYDAVDLPPDLFTGAFVPIGNLLWPAVTTGILGYLLGYALCRLKLGPPRSRPTLKPNLAQLAAVPNTLPPRLPIAVGGLLLGYAASFLALVAQIGLPTLATNAGEARLAIVEHGPLLSVLLSFGWTLPPLGVYALGRYGRSLGRAHQLLLFIAVMAPLATLALLGSRSFVFQPALVSVVVANYSWRRLPWPLLLALGVGAFVTLGELGYLRDSTVSETFLEDVAGQSGIPSQLLRAGYLYTYIRYPVSALRDILQLIPRSYDYSYGTLSLSALLAPLPGRHQSPDMFFRELLGYEFVGGGVPATLLGPLYADGGLVGILVGLGMFGALSCWAYRRLNLANSRNRLRVTLVYAWIVQLGLFGMFTSLLPYITAVWIPLVYIVVSIYVESSPGESSATSG